MRQKNLFSLKWSSRSMQKNNCEIAPNDDHRCHYWYGSRSALHSSAPNSTQQETQASVRWSTHRKSTSHRPKKINLCSFVCTWHRAPPGRTHTPYPPPYFFTPLSFTSKNFLTFSLNPPSPLCKISIMCGPKSFAQFLASMPFESSPTYCRGLACGLESYKSPNHTSPLSPPHFPSMRQSKSINWHLDWWRQKAKAWACPRLMSISPGSPTSKATNWPLTWLTWEVQTTAEMPSP